MDDHSTHDEDSPYHLRVAYAADAAPAGNHDALDAERIAAALRAVLAAHEVPAATLSIALVDDAAMIALHGQYLGIAETTDVLTFDLSDEGAEGVDGEIVICVDLAAREAALRQHALADEVLLYAVHGCLHLLGYDDLNAEDAARMHAREDELLTALGVGPVYRSANP
jgi:probable rRNA maturation factor